MKHKIGIKERLLRIFFFFPLQLIILHIKKNHLLLIIWLLILGFANGSLGVKYGVRSLFLYPEYLGRSDGFAFLITGFATGGFIMAFNLYSYIMHGFRFPFIASLSRPFFKFCLNNFAIPIAYVIYFVVNSYKFQVNKELIDSGQAAFNLFAYALGNLLFIAISFGYFFSTNRDALKLFGGNPEKAKKKEASAENAVKQTERRIASIRRNNRTWRVETYLASPVRVALARNGKHYSKEVIHQVLRQNHINASIFEILIVVTFISLGSFGQSEVFHLPASASVFIALTMILMLISAFYSWFKGWTTSILLFILLLFNVASNRDNFLKLESQAFGIDYTVPPVNYIDYMANGQPTDEEIKADKAAMIQILENWKRKLAVKYGDEKPPLILINSSGGGLRSGMWSFRCLTHLDSITDGRLFDYTFLTTGSSGGMLGSSYYRKLRMELGNQYIKSPEVILDEFGQDLLNPIIFTYATNDISVRYRSFVENNTRHYIDRAYAFEKKFNKNTHHKLDVPISDYRIPEAQSDCPMFIYSPAVSNDGRKMLISPSPITFLTRKNHNKVAARTLTENISFSHLFKQHGADSLKLTTALRMSATFPYILPSTTLPTVPKIDVMDAGVRDNYGFTTTAKFIFECQDWIKENVSEILVIQLRDLEKVVNVDEDNSNALMSRVLSPIGTIYSNIFNTHNYSQDDLTEEVAQWCPVPFDVRLMELKQAGNTKIPLSWHLTAIDKRMILEGVYKNNNQSTIEKLKTCLATD